ncbi:hypothetical protein Ancab_015925 [Ancistrocladus abbreviatus]
MANWENLPEAILIEIAERVGVYEDFEAMGEICRQWRSAWRKAKYCGTSPQVPWLMLEEDEGSPTTRRFYSLSNGGIVRTMTLPEANGDKRCYSSQGWLMIISRDLSMSLLNPFSRFQIQLPDKKSLHDYEHFVNDEDYIFFVHKFAMSSSPLTDRYSVMIVYGRRRALAFWRLGDDAWTEVEAIHLTRRGASDIIYYEGEFYAVAFDGPVVACNFDGHGKKLGDWREETLIKTRLVADLSEVSELFVECFHKTYLVESNGKLLLVLRGLATYLNDDDYKGGPTFRVWEVNVSSGEAVEMKNLEGDNTSWMCPLSSFYSTHGEAGRRRQLTCIPWADDGNSTCYS